MGPHFFKCGKQVLPLQLTNRLRRLQWGRTFSSAESPKGDKGDKGDTGGFNGAALFQVRKGR